MSVFIDVETNGLPNCNNLKFGEYPNPKNLLDYSDCRIVQITFLLCNDDLEELLLKDYVIKGDFEIHNSVIHGITKEISEKNGKDLKEVFEELKEVLYMTKKIYAHNADFDVNVIKSEMIRSGEKELLSLFSEKEVVCTMKKTINFVNAKNKYGKLKVPSLKELYYKVFKREIEGAHNSKYDVLNLYEIVKKIRDLFLI